MLYDTTLSDADEVVSDSAAVQKLEKKTLQLLAGAAFFSFYS